ncbi:MAG: hypothetical protein L0Y54_03280 [Sporichthyaceae bacterium]|nr:hypothetical protein [Sporichthyaceae bacterium]
MIRSRRHAGLLAALVLATFAVLVGCATPDEGRSLGPNHPHTQAGDIAVRSVMLVASPDNQDASLVMTLVNQGSESDVLQAVRVGRLDRPDAGQQVPVSVNVPAGGAVNVGSPGQPAVVLRDIGRLAQPGEFVDVELLFGTAGEAAVSSILHPATGFYASYAPSPLPSPSPTPPTPLPTGSVGPTPSPTSAPTPSPTEPATESPTASPTGTGTPS